MDQLKIDKAMLERDAKSTMTKLTDAQLRLDEYARNMTDLEVARNKLYGEVSILPEPEVDILNHVFPVSGFRTKIWKGGWTSPKSKLPSWTR